ncbi:hypothetical protein GJ744_003985 [Endocarpon pusillum]|uniref:Uncharacterized protein n=1 Tax=Endocarpon pusillum TaxID=364733 RepID=A0A8H7DXT9_9EURO|nr:hypothetical protein GJ744_003985 [Endocarpon pusillum]
MVSAWSALGLVSGAAVSGDKTCQFRGSKCSYVIREIDQGQYVLVGQVYEAQSEYGGQPVELLEDPRQCDTGWRHRNDGAFYATRQNNPTKQENDEDGEKLKKPRKVKQRPTVYPHSKLTPEEAEELGPIGV